MALSVKGLMRAAPAVLVPAIEIPLLLWTRDSYIDLHPAEVLVRSPTISRAAADPAIADPFAITITVISVLIGAAVFFVARAFLTSINSLFADDQRLQRTAHALLIVTVIAQSAGTLGMVVTAYIHLGVSRDSHMLSSFIFFSGQSLAIILSALLCRILRKRHINGQAIYFPGMLLPDMNRVRTKAAIIISIGAGVYLVLFRIKNVPLPLDAYFVQYIYTIWEILLLAAFVIYLALFAPDLYQAGKHKTPRPTELFSKGNRLQPAASARPER